MYIMLERPSDKTGLSRNDAIAQIMAIENQIFQSGSVDTEKSELDHILDQLNKGKISPEKAIELVTGLNNSRQDYH